jgi:hypothetical protein
MFPFNVPDLNQKTPDIYAFHMVFSMAFTLNSSHPKSMFLDSSDQPAAFSFQQKTFKSL